MTAPAPTPPLHVALIDDDPDLLAATAQHLRLSGFVVHPFDSAAAALADLPADFPGAVLSDIRMPGVDGLTLFRHLRARDPALPVILITGHGTIDMAVQAIQEGAYDFLSKPYTPERLLTAARHAATQRRLSLENRQLQQALQQQTEGPQLLGDSAVMVRLRDTLRHIANADADVLIEGETGSGKEVVATLLHRWSRRAAHRLVAINCGALPENIIESELFGHEAGAFTGAQKRRTGLIEHASRGTLLLDEIESMPLAAQTRLLRVLENRRVQPLGSNEEREVDLRVVAASKVDLSDPAQRSQFRADLYYRLNVITLRLPPLRERREDVPLLFAYFCSMAEKKYDRAVPPASATVLEHLALHDWPGNVRELAHYAERHVLGLGQPLDQPPGDNGLTLPARMERYEAQLIRQTLAANHGSVKATLAELGIPRKTFYDKLQRHGIQRQQYTNAEGTEPAD